MLRIAPIAIAIALIATPTMSQEYRGNWACRDGTAMRAGILTIYGEVYGFASTIFGDKSSGTGALTPYQDGVGFNDGPLRAARGIEAGRVVNDPVNGPSVQLETSDAIVMLCTPR